MKGIVPTRRSGRSDGRLLALVVALAMLLFPLSAEGETEAVTGPDDGGGGEPDHVHEHRRNPRRKRRTEIRRFGVPSSLRLAPASAAGIVPPEGERR